MYVWFAIRVASNFCHLPVYCHAVKHILLTNYWFADTASATKALRQFGAEKLLSVISLALPEDVAYAVVRGAALRQRSVYYPYFRARVTPIAYQFMPGVFEKIASVLFADS